MAGTQLFLLFYERDAEALARFPHYVRLIADNDENIVELKRLQSFQYPADHRPAGDHVGDFGKIGLHSYTLARGKDYRDFFHGKAIIVLKYDLDKNISKLLV
jgi:hypothetical protein